MFKESYTENEFKSLLENTDQRIGWEFSKMNTLRQTVPWDYLDIVKKYIKPNNYVLDVGTGGGERFLSLADYFEKGVGIDIDPEMIRVAKENAAGRDNISFHLDTEMLSNTQGYFDLILNRHASFDLDAVLSHLKKEGYFITQQVGENNMLNIKSFLKKTVNRPTITKAEVLNARLKLISFMEYDVEYVVRDVESLVFWLQALDDMHADLPGAEALKNVEIFNKMLEGNIDERGFITNEQRFLVIAQK